MKNNSNEISGLYLIDKEGQTNTTEVNIVPEKMENIFPTEVVYLWRSERDFNSFMRFANQYAKNMVLLMKRVKMLGDK